jgi:hypothetical protein
MGYAVVGYFDKESDEIIRDLWRLMSDKCIDDYLHMSDNSPHFKFEIYETIDTDKVKKEIKKISDEISAVTVCFKKFGFYPLKTNTFLTLDLADNEDIILLQKKMHSLLAPYGDIDKRGFFEAGIWKPDIQLTMTIDQDKLPVAVQILNQTDLPFSGRLESIGIIEFPPAKQLFRFNLKNTTI